MRKALVVGVNYYSSGGNLYGCINDAHEIKNVLERHCDGSVNFSVKLKTASDENSEISRGELKDLVEDLFKDDSEIALLYFAGHGHIESTGGYLLASDATRGDDGLPLGEIITLANQSKAKNKIIILDSCHSGIAGKSPNSENTELTEGMTILTASTESQYASEKNGSGVFTSLLVDALQGAASNLVGDVTPGSLYSHVDQSLGPWEQRPIFKTNVKSFVSLRKVQAPIELKDLQRITEFFPTAGFDYKLDPSYEPRDEGRTADMPKADPENNKRFAVLQKYNRINLLKPVGTLHMWNAAMESKSCKLTVTGEHYRNLVEKGQI